MSEFKPSLFDLWRDDESHFDVEKLTKDYNVGLRPVLTMLRDRQPVNKIQAERVLKALSQMTGKTYSLETVKVKLYEDQR